MAYTAEGRLIIQIKLKMNTAKCPNCNQAISNIHYEAHDPHSLSGYKGSASFTAVAFPCGHALGAVPMTWEMRLEEIDRLIRELDQKIGTLNKDISLLSATIRNSNTRTR